MKNHNVSLELSREYIGFDDWQDRKPTTKIIWSKTVMAFILNALNKTALCIQGEVEKLFNIIQAIVAIELAIICKRTVSLEAFPR